jgi:hypothetical protein
MPRAINGIIKNLPYLCLIGVVALGIMTIVGTGGGNGDDGGTGDENGNGNGGDGGGDGYPAPVYNLPDISHINANPSDTFIVPLTDFGGLVEGVMPMPGTDSGACYHPGAHVEFPSTSTREVVDIIAPFDGVITGVHKCYPTEGVYDNQQYKIHMAYALRNGDVFELEIGLEPMAGNLCDSNQDYFMPYILVAEGDEVTKGDKLGEMVLEPGFKSHIHFNSKFQGIFMCPDFFTTDVIDQIDGYYMGSCNGNALTGTMCYLPASGESNTHY